MPKLVSYNVDLNLGVLHIKGAWKPDKAEKQAAWELYVEMATRIVNVPLTADEGMLREALTSFYSLFETTREILKRGGPTLAKPKAGGDLSFGLIAVGILNVCLRPLLSKWHPLLEQHEASRGLDTSQVEHERAWTRDAELRVEIETARHVLSDYALQLERVIGIPSLRGN